MHWAYGVTCVPIRFDPKQPHYHTLQRTLNSLALAGFDNPRLFIDGACEIPEWMQRYDRTQHEPPLRTAGNWVTAAWSLLHLHPGADRYAIFQDDIIAVRNLRQYIETHVMPSKGYLNLYTYPNKVKAGFGWHKAGAPGGKGALGLVFDNLGLRQCLGRRYLADRPLDPGRGWRAIDGGIVSAMNEAGYEEWVHNPSLVQHIGRTSSMGNGTQPEANTFPGEIFDATTLNWNVHV